jgi:hypothetical protein
MTLQCEHCQRNFPTNTALYKHKHKAHNKSSIVLLNHSHDKMNKKANPKRPRQSQKDDDLALPKDKKPKISDGNDPQFDDKLVVIDRYDDPNEIPTDSDPKPSPPKHDPQHDKDLKVIDDYTLDDADDDQLTIIDEYDDDGQSDENLSVVEEIDESNRKQVNNYKRKYLDCLRSHKSLRAKFLKKMAKMSSNYKINIERIKKQMHDQCQDKINKREMFHERQTADLEELLKAKQADAIQDLHRKHNDAIKNLIISHKKELDDNEKDCQRKLQLLNNQIKTMQEDNEDLSSLSKAIFNCTTMEEIFEIQRLIKNHQIDRVIRDHLPTLQNLFLSLSYGIIPICQPQREQVTDNQRSVVENVQTASPQSAKKILQEKRPEIVNLFTIIKDSIKLARDTYNRYGAIV